jgi:hypothetical protein
MTTITTPERHQTPVGSPDSEPIRGAWRKLRSGQWGVEIREGRGSGWDNVEGEIVEIVRRSDGSVSRLKLEKMVGPRRGRLAPLYAVSKIPKEAA